MPTGPEPPHDAVRARRHITGQNGTVAGWVPLLDKIRSSLGEAHPSALSLHRTKLATVDDNNPAAVDSWS